MGEKNEGKSAEGRDRTRPRVWVIGGGITGLTAAHELSERGIDVIVVEADEDVRNPEKPALGGMARTQWARLPPGGKKGMQSTIKPIAFRPIHFEVDSPEILPDDKARLPEYAEAIGSYRAEITAYHADGIDDARELAQKQLQAVVAALKKHDPTLQLTAQIKANTERAEKNQTVEISLGNDMVPGEHGFRFFHGFYRHVFDTMRRIQIFNDDDNETRLVHRTVYDNLAPSDAFCLDFPPGDGKPARSVEFPRRRMYGLRELFDTLRDFMRHAGHTAEDISRISLSIFKYMTSCRGRREKEYEEMSWWDFIQGPTFDEPAARHYRDAPRVLVGLTAEQCDARTQGNVIVQMLMDVLFKGERADATLNAHTSGAWFEPWRQYLEQQDVEFVHGTLKGFKKSGSSVLPVFEGSIGRGPTPDDYFILATSLPSLVGDSSGNTKGLIHDFFEKLADDNPKNGQDFVKLRDFGQTIRQNGQPALRDMNGIQFYFGTEVPKKAGRSLYLDSKWQLSSLSQTNFWERPRAPVDGYRGVLSVDIGAWDVDHEQPGTSAWKSDPDAIAGRVWKQITVTIPNLEKRFELQPLWYHIDDSIEFHNDPEKGVKRNRAPYLVSRPGDWKMRPGELPKHAADDSGYDLQCGNWILAGTFMKTYTRLTSMESANESARHAVNGILHDLNKNHGGHYPSCQVWNPEDHEFPDLQWLVELDERLYAYPNRIKSNGEVEETSTPEQHLPHFIDILAPEDVTEWLHLVDGGISMDQAVRELMTRVMQWRKSS